MVIVIAHFIDIHTFLDSSYSDQPHPSLGVEAWKVIATDILQVQVVVALEVDLAFEA